MVELVHGLISLELSQYDVLLQHSLQREVHNLAVEYHKRGESGSAEPYALGYHKAVAVPHIICIEMFDNPVVLMRSLICMLRSYVYTYARCWVTVRVSLVRQRLASVRMLRSFVYTYARCWVIIHVSLVRQQLASKFAA
jgi:uncharacterized MAPEG superfamily protein